MKKFGLIGYPLTHSFSKKYFTEKFQNENIDDCEYSLYEMQTVEPNLLDLIHHLKPDLKGLNVTIPHKQAVIPFLSSLDEAAKKIGAVNVIKVNADGSTKGYNSDYYGFKLSLELFLEGVQVKALVLGTGGASKAVLKALQDLNIEYIQVSRTSTDESICYEEISEEVFLSHKLIINTTPLGMYPNVDSVPNLPYHLLDGSFFFYDLVYNPLTTAFMNKALEKGSKAINGLEMLHLQADKSWEIWNA